MTSVCERCQEHVPKAKGRCGICGADWDAPMTHTDRESVERHFKGRYTKKQLIHPLMRDRLREDLEIVRALLTRAETAEAQLAAAIARAEKAEAARDEYQLRLIEAKRGA